jgi:hypothetical protein
MFHVKRLLQDAAPPYPFLFSYGRLFWAIETMLLNPPRFIESAADDGTITKVPFSFKPSKSIFIARRCNAVGLLM